MPNTKKYIASALFMALFMLAISVLPLVADAAVRRITVKWDGQEKLIRTNSDKPGDVIKLAGVPMNPGDGYEIVGVNRELQDGSVIQVLRAKAFKVHRNNETKEYTSTKKTVGEALKSIGIATKKDLVHPPVDTLLENDTHIYVIKKGETFNIKEEPIEVPIEYKEDFDMAFGTEQVIYEGKQGTVTVISKSYKDEIGGYNIMELSRRETVKPEPKVIKKGMAQSVKTPNGFKRYTKKLRCEATAYIATGNPTATGIMPYWGVIAVDPRFIPLGTKVYIPGYGIALAADTGGAIRGNIIDLFMNTYRQAINWGRRDVDVYILAE